MLRSIINTIYNAYCGHCEIKCCVCSYPFLTDKKNINSRLYCGINCYYKDTNKNI